ncbi:MAG: hypothetical protein KC418_23985 [Anaerolineales bacterium]|nr:hypothetical protein [Anaerolineales bacterium]
MENQTGLLQEKNGKSQKSFWDFALPVAHPRIVAGAAHLLTKGGRHDGTGNGALV